LLSQSAEAERALREEVSRVLGGRAASFSDLPHLIFTRRVVTEAMRLYPPAWMIGRRAIAEYALGDYIVPPRSIVFMSPFVLHRDARFFVNPDRFDPARWTPEFESALPKFAYFPFGGGARQCIGEQFAWMEATLVLATVAQSWRLELLPGQRITPQPLITLRARHGVRMTVRAH